MGDCMELIIALVMMIVFLALSFGNLILGISGAVIAAQNDDAKGHEGHVWEYVVTHVVILFCLAVGIGYDRQVKEKTDASGNKTHEVTESTGIIGLANFAISIWGMVIYFELHGDDKKFYTDNHPSLWTWVSVVAILHFTLCMIVCLCIVLYFLLACCSAGSSSSSFSSSSYRGTLYTYRDPFQFFMRSDRQSLLSV